MSCATCGEWTQYKNLEYLLKYGTDLDRFYVKKDLLKNIVAVKHTICNISDHWGVIAEFNELQSSYFKSGNGLWTRFFFVCTKFGNKALLNILQEKRAML